MARKSKKLKQEALDAEARLKEILELERLAKEEEANKLKELEQRITTIAEQEKVFIGLILETNEMMQMIHAFIKEPEKKIQVRFNVYLTDED